MVRPRTAATTEGERAQPTDQQGGQLSTEDGQPLCCRTRTVRQVHRWLKAFRWVLIVGGRRHHHLIPTNTASEAAAVRYWPALARPRSRQPGSYGNVMWRRELQDATEQ